MNAYNVSDVLAVACYFYVLDSGYQDSKKISCCQSRRRQYLVYNVLRCRSELGEWNILVLAMLVLGPENDV